GQRMQKRSHLLFDDARRSAAELFLPLEVIDAEILLDGRNAVVHYLRWAECDPRPLLDRLASTYHILASLHDMRLAAPPPEEEAHAACGASSCGTGGCGSCRGGSCSACHGGPVARTASLAATKDLRRVSLV